MAEACGRGSSQAVVEGQVQAAPSAEEEVGHPTLEELEAAWLAGEAVPASGQEAQDSLSEPAAWSDWYRASREWLQSRMVPVV